MGEITAAPEAIRTFATTTAGVGTTIAGLSSVDAAANAAVAAGVFGPIGQEFLVAFAAAQASALATAQRIAAGHAAQAAAALAGAAAFEGADAGSAVAVRGAST